MAPRKAKPTDTPAAETSTANNEDFGAAAAKTDAPIYFFTGGPEADRLPPIGQNNWIGRLADVAYWSGYFNATPAQLAVRILAGDSVGLGPAHSLFDLTVSDEGTITHRSAGNYQNTADVVAIAGNAAGDATIERDAGSGVNRSTDDAKGPGGIVSPGGIVVGYDFKAAAAAENANPGPVLSTTGETAPDALEGKPGDSSPISGETGRESASIGDVAPADPAEPAEFDQFRDDLAAAGRDPIETSDPFASTADPNAGAGVVSGSNPLDGLDPQATIAGWRSTIADKLADLGFGLEKRSEKLKEFDGKNIEGKKAMFQQCELMHAERLKSKRDDVLKALAADGKTDDEARKGFFFYADVPDDSTTWTYADASKAWATMEKDFPELAKAIAVAS